MKNKAISIISLLLLLSYQSCAIASPEENQDNVNAVVSVAENCKFTGWVRKKEDILFYATCDDVKKSLSIKDAGLLNSFVVKTAETDFQGSSIELTVYDSPGLNWDKLQQVLSENDQAEK
jgi:2-phospho-L-lactate transferase/gluconeogenesis factor (CofD/UPF0052 family)